jgi:hypothetical protein
MKPSGDVKSVKSKVGVAICVGALGLIGIGVSSKATAGETKSSSTSTVPAASNAFCYPAIKWVGTYSVNVEWALGLTDNHPLPNQMTSNARTAVMALAVQSLALASKAPTALMASQLRRLSVELKQSRLPIDVVRAEAAFGATGYPSFKLMCQSAMRLMTPTNPLGGFNPA